MFAFSSLQIISIRSLRRLVTRNSVEKKEKCLTGLKENVPQPTRFIKAPVKNGPGGFTVVESWTSPLMNSTDNIRAKSERYMKRFYIADAINKTLLDNSASVDQILDTVCKQYSRFDNMNAFNALGYLHARHNEQHDRNNALSRPNQLIGDARFLQLCGVLYKKSRSYPPNACIGIVFRLSALGVPFQTPLVYAYVSLLKQSINAITLNDALTLAQFLHPHKSLRLPTALMSGLKVLIKKMADDNFDMFTNELGQENAIYQEPNFLIFFRHFGDSLTSRLRSRLCQKFSYQFIDANSIIGSDKLIEFLSLIKEDWLTSSMFYKLFQKFEQCPDFTFQQTLQISDLLIRFQRLKDPLLLRNLAQGLERQLSEHEVVDETELSLVVAFICRAMKLNFATPSLMLTTLQLSGLSSFLENLDGSPVTTFLELIVTHLPGKTSAISELINNPDFESLLNPNGKSPAEIWSSLETKAKLIILYLSYHHDGVIIEYMPHTFCSRFDEIEEMLSCVTVDNVFDITEKLFVLPRLLKSIKLCGFEANDYDLVLRLYIPAIDPRSKISDKMYFMPVGTSAFYQNRLDVVWHCHLRLLVLQQFLLGSGSAITTIPVDLTRFQNFSTDEERQNYVRNCIENAGDPVLVDILQKKK